MVSLAVSNHLMPLFELGLGESRLEECIKRGRFTYVGNVAHLRHRVSRNGDRSDEDRSDEDDFGSWDLVRENFASSKTSRSFVLAISNSTTKKFSECINLKFSFDDLRVFS
jgi:hypothetical protein